MYYQKVRRNERKEETLRPDSWFSFSIILWYLTNCRVSTTKRRRRYYTNSLQLFSSGTSFVEDLEEKKPTGTRILLSRGVHAIEWPQERAVIEKRSREVPKHLPINDYWKREEITRSPQASNSRETVYPPNKRLWFASTRSTFPLFHLLELTVGKGPRKDFQNITEL